MYRETVVRKLTGLKWRYVSDMATRDANMTKMSSSKLKSLIISVGNREVAGDICQVVEKDKVTFVPCDLANVPFRDEAFCCVVCVLTLSTIED
jgi:ubiquinone/menaquinone biosynthesis C-methylase UbiE